MRKNAPRKWLHAILDLLPVILIPVFMIYSHRHTIDSGSIQVPQNQVVDFNQQLNGYTGFNNFQVTSNVVGNDAIIVELDYTFGQFWKSQIYLNEHKYLVKGSSFKDFESPLVFAENYQINYIINTQSDTWVDFIYIFTGLGISGTQFAFYCNNVVEGDTFTLRNIQLFDLTQMFGSGNEPTIAQFNTWFPNDYYTYTLSHKELLKGTSTITYQDSDIMSQSMYQLYNSVDKYFNMNNIFNMGAVYDWFVLNIFNGNAPLIMYIVWNIALYELVIDLMFLLYALFMWFVDWCKSLIERTYDVGRGK